MIQDVSIEQLVQKNKERLLCLIIDNKEESIYYIDAADWGRQLTAKREALKLYEANDYRIDNGYKCVFFENKTQMGIQFEFHEQKLIFNPFYNALETMIKDYKFSFDSIMFKIEKDQLEDYILTIFGIGNKLKLFDNNMIYKKE